MFRGSMVALITPMTPDGRVDDKALEALVAFHIENGTNAIVAMGTTGESATLSHKEHIEVVKRVIELAQGKIPVIAGTGSNSTSEAIELTTAAAEAKADGALLVTPYYNKPTQEGLYRHFKAVADAVAIPQILYNVPGRTACSMTPETIERLSHISNIVGIKEVTDDTERMKQVFEACGDRLDAVSGEDPVTREFIALGGKGCISVTANVAPKLMRQMCDAALAGDDAQAKQIDELLQPLHKNLFLESNPIPVKWAMARMGYGDVNGIRLPLIPLADQYHELVYSAMRAAHIEC